MITRAVRLQRCVVALVVFAMAGCGSIASSHVLTGTPLPRSAGVRVFMEGQGAPTSFREIAIIQTVGSGVYANLADVVGGLQERAATLGCTVVVNVRVDTGSATSSGTGVCGID